MNYPNYAGKAQRALVEFSSLWCKWEGAGRDAFVAKLLGSSIDTAQHFSLPRGGRLFDDNLRGLRGMSPRLPFPTVTLSYQAVEDDPDGYQEATGKNLAGFHNRSIPCPLRCIIASEVSRDSMTNFGDRLNASVGSGINPVTHEAASAYRQLMDGAVKNWPGTSDSAVCILVNALGLVRGHWVPSAIAWLIHDEWDKADAPGLVDMNERLKKLGLVNTNKNAVKIVGTPQTAFPYLFGEAVKQLGADNALAMGANDIAEEAVVVLEFCEALSCTNVTQEVVEHVDPRVNAKRVRNGKLPLYETRILKVVVPNEGSGRGSAIGTHAGPRQHLRRGHIRRLYPDTPDQRNIWVNSCVVGDPLKGRIDKRYGVETAPVVDKSNIG